MANNNLQKRLYEAEAIPPEGMWSRIVDQLDKEVTTDMAPVVVMPARKNSWMKIALAASVLGFVITTALWLTKTSKEKASPDNTTATPAPVVIKDTVYLTQENTPSQTPVTAPAENGTMPGNNNLPNNPVYKPTNPAVVRNPVPYNQPAPDNIQKDLQIPDQPPVLVNTQPKNIIIKGQDGKPLRNIEVVKTVDNNALAGPDSKGDKTIGNILSKISLASDGEEIDSIINNSTYWKKQVKEWREKLIKSGYTPNLINSLDFIELKKLLEQK